MGFTVEDEAAEETISFTGKVGQAVLINEDMLSATITFSGKVGD